MSHPINARVRIHNRTDDADAPLDPWDNPVAGWVDVGRDVEAWLRQTSAQEVTAGADTEISDWSLRIPGHELQGLELGHRDRVHHGDAVYEVVGRPLEARADVGGDVHHLEARLRLVS